MTDPRTIPGQARSSLPDAEEAAPRDAENAGLPAAATENIDVLTRFYEREEAGVSGVQFAIERISAFFGSPAYFAFALSFIVAWALLNTWGTHAGWTYVDKPPFFWLQGVVSSNALLLTVAVLIRQTRMGQLAEHRAHLDLQINLLTEQKVTKTLQLIDELRRELDQKRPLDHDLTELSKPADPQAILHAIKNQDLDRPANPSP
ncbi:MAG: DUF1003 domain-containing protein [Pseudomonadota bacterium]|nr:DUF1003 domain-containing protein [Pseudomonadota bacterium]